MKYIKKREGSSTKMLTIKNNLALESKENDLNLEKIHSIYIILRK